MSEMKIWKDMSAAEKEDLDFLKSQQTHYESACAQSIPDYKKICDAIYKIQKAAQKKLADLEMKEKMEEQKKAFQEKRQKTLSESINLKSIYYVANDNKYYIYQETESRWDPLSQEGLYKLIGLDTIDDKRYFDETLRNSNRMKMRVVSTFKEGYENDLNLISKNEWLKPTPLEKDETVDEWIDLLVYSVAGEQQEVKDHIEQVIAWKYLHPEDYMIPAQVPYGEGGAGKNEFVQKVLKTIFGRNQVIVLGYDEVFGQYNGQILGKTIVLIDETAHDKTKTDAVKKFVMNETVTINTKYGTQGTFDSTALYFLSGNNLGGPLLLDGSSADRRFSIYKISRSILEIVSDKYGVAFDKNSLKSGEEPAAVLYNSEKWRLSDKTLVAKWLWYIIDKWEPLMKKAPSAYRGEDYNNLKAVQRKPWQDLVHKIFGPEVEMAAVNHIKGSTLHEIYKLYHEKIGSSTQHLVSRNLFLENVKNEVKNHYKEWHWGTFTLYKKVDGVKKQTTTTGFYRGQHKTFTDNEHHFIDGTTGKPKLEWWIE